LSPAWGLISFLCYGKNALAFLKNLQAGLSCLEVLKHRQSAASIFTRRLFENRCWLQGFFAHLYAGMPAAGCFLAGAWTKAWPEDVYNHNF